MSSISGHKQHLNLSNLACSVIENDLEEQNDQSLSGFLNGIFSRCCDQSEASIHLALARKRDRLEHLLAPVPATPEKEQTLRLLIQEEERRLLEQVGSYAKDNGFKFYLNVENLKLLEDSAPLIEAYYGDRPMRYFKAVIEEYARHTPLEREALYHRDWIDTLTAAISNGQLVTVETGGKRFDVRPWQVTCDESQLHYYLIGLSTPVGTGQPEIPASLRITRITSIKVRPKSYRSGRITVAEALHLQQAVRENGVQFLIGAKETIVVRLSAEGLKLFRQLRHLRPHIRHTEQDELEAVLTFHCTPYQAEAYFLRLGAEAEILAPPGLRERFISIYRSAIHLYEKKENHDE